MDASLLTIIHTTKMDDRELRSLLKIGPISIGNFMDILGLT